MLTLSGLNKVISRETPYSHNKNMILFSLGVFLEICSKDERNKKIDIQSFIHWVKPAVLHGQYHFLYSEDKMKYTGFIMWAWVNDNTLQRYLTSDRFNLHPSEWNEGRNLIIVDYCNLTKLHQKLRKILKKVKKHKNNFDSFNYCIRNDSGIPTKIKKII
ncbi:toxin-activating lysine-acyltransferase [Photobacterium frigidiphilum]|uniref:toxin-activating lysine-acyltransferase n=1 Tax=Photobacterium frigidiphilum TaxID=264736 RepID=UPI003D0FDBC8